MNEDQKTKTFETCECTADEDEEMSGPLYAISDYNPIGDGQISLQKGQPVNVLKRSNENWWWVESNGCYGYAPVNHLGGGVVATQPEWQDEEYFGNYGNLKLHLEMLSDKPRTEAYMNAILNNADKLRDKVILDVGCGTGVLSMLCVKHAHPKHVYAVEASDIAEYTQQAVEKNGMADKITVLHDFAENAKIEDDVDVIISEWMGTMLLFEMMIESVLSMRDRFMKPELTIWPSSASLFLVPCSAGAHFNRKLEFWDCQYGLDFSSFKTLAKEDLLSKPYHDYVLPCGDCLAKGQSVLRLDMKTVTIESLENIECKFEFVIDQGETMHGFCTWFEVEFCPLSEDVNTVILNTGPDNELTHWKQNLFFLDSPVQVNAGDVISGTLTISRNPEYRRHLRAFFDFKVIPGSEESTIIDPSSVQKMFYVWR